MKDIWLGLAKDISRRSTCSRLSVGAVITSLDFKELISYGYNGNYSGGPNTCDRNEAGNCGCIHAENNALNKPRSRQDMAIFLTDSPCVMCAKLIINAQNIKKVIYKEEYRNIEGIEMLRKSNIEVEKYGMEQR